MGGDHGGKAAPALRVQGRAAEELGQEPGHALGVVFVRITEQGAQDGIAQHLRIEPVREAVDHSRAANVFDEAHVRHLRQPIWRRQCLQIRA